MCTARLHPLSYGLSHLQQAGACPIDLAPDFLVAELS